MLLMFVVVERPMIAANLFVCLQAFVVEDNKQVILEGQLHVALQTIDKEACSLTQKEVNACNNCKHSNHHFVLTV